jgi:hypothetical protein
VILTPRAMGRTDPAWSGGGTAALRQDWLVPYRGLVGQDLVDVSLHLIGQGLDVGLLEHARMAAKDVEGPDATGGPAVPTEERILVAIDIGLVVCPGLTAIDGPVDPNRRRGRRC